MYPSILFVIAAVPGVLGLTVAVSADTKVNKIITTIINIAIPTCISSIRFFNLYTVSVS